MRCHLRLLSASASRSGSSGGWQARSAALAVRCPDDTPGAAWLLGLAGAASAALMLLQPPAQCYFQPTDDGSVDRLTRWRTRSWAIGSGRSPGFHLKAVNPVLEKHMERWSQGISSETGAPASVLVPLCGKTFDMPFLCELGYGVVGVEGVERAIIEFRAEHKMRVKGLKAKSVFSRQDGSWVEKVKFSPSETFQGARSGEVFKKGDQGLGYYSEVPGIWHGKVSQGKTSVPLDIISGDMFEVTSDLVASATFVKSGRFDLVFDRGALVAIPPEARPSYVATISSVLRTGGRILLVAVDYDQKKLPYDSKRMSPPPFSVTADHVKKLFPDHSWSVTVLDDQPADMSSPAFKDINVREVAYLIEKRSDGGWISSGSASASAPFWMAGVTAAAGGLAALAFCLRPRD